MRCTVCVGSDKINMSFHLGISQDTIYTEERKRQAQTSHARKANITFSVTIGMN